MMINKIFQIEGNEFSPSATFYSDKKLIIEGESRLENPREFYDELYIQIEKAFKNIYPEVIEFKMEYISSSSILSLISLIKKMLNKKNVLVYWLFDKMDEDICELGEIIKETHGVDLILKEI